MRTEGHSLDQAVQKAPVVRAAQPLRGDVGGPGRETQGMHHAPGDLVTDPREAGSEQSRVSYLKSFKRVLRGLRESLREELEEPCPCPIGAYFT